MARQRAQPMRRFPDGRFFAIYASSAPMAAMMATMAPPA